MSYTIKLQQVDLLPAVADEGGFYTETSFSLLPVTKALPPKPDASAADGDGLNPEDPSTLVVAGSEGLGLVVCLPDKYDLKAKMIRVRYEYVDDKTSQGVGLDWAARVVSRDDVTQAISDKSSSPVLLYSLTTGFASTPGTRCTLLGCGNCKNLPQPRRLQCHLRGCCRA